ncbi:hypothetical protein QJQ45_024593 [Haematococcus lacustris]|nr:hypothetical protein QJQ45_024593 [Haematococcus lacustris]
MAAAHHSVPHFAELVKVLSPLRTTTAPVSMTPAAAAAPSETNHHLPGPQPDAPTSGLAAAEVPKSGFPTRATTHCIDVMPCVLVLFDPLQNPLHRQSLGANRFQSGTAVKTSVTAAKAAQKTMPPSLVHRVKQQQPVQTKAEATVAAMAPLFSGVTTALSSLAQRGADKHFNGVLHAAVMATQANAVKALEYSGDSSKHFAFLQSCMQQGMAGFGLAMPTATAGAGSSTAQHRVMEEEEEEEEEEVEVVYDSQ